MPVQAMSRDTGTHPYRSLLAVSAISPQGAGRVASRPSSEATQQCQATQFLLIFKRFFIPSCSQEGACPSRIC